MSKKTISSEDEFFEIKRGLRSFAFLNLRAAVSNISDLISSVHLYNEFPHTIDKDAFLSFVHEKHRAREGLEFENEDFTDYVMRLDLGRNVEFLNELAFLHLINRFLTYCCDILAVAALGSPDRFDLNIRIQTSKLAGPNANSRFESEMGAAIIARLGFMTYPELRRLLLSKIKLRRTILKQLEIVDRAVRKRNKLTHGRGIASLAADIYETGKWRPRDKVSELELNRLWRAISEISRAIDIAMMKKFDVWRGVDICAPGLYRKKGGAFIRSNEQRT